MRKTPEQLREDKKRYNATYRASHVEHERTKAEKRYALHGEEMRAAARLNDHAKRAADPEGERAKVRARYAANPEPTRQRCRQARAENPELFSLQEKARREAEPEKHHVWDVTKRRRRRAAKANAPINDLTHAQWMEIQAAQDHRCYYCKKRHKGKLHQDHIQALSQGGSHTLHNVVAACKSCNSHKFTGPAPTPVQPLLLTIAPSRKKDS